MFIYFIYIYTFIFIYIYIYILYTYYMIIYYLYCIYLRYYNTVLQCTVWFNMMFRLSETSGQDKPSVPHFRIASVGRCCSCVFYIFFSWFTANSGYSWHQLTEMIQHFNFKIFHGPEPNNSSAAEDVQPNSWISRTARFLHFHRLFVCLCRLMVCPFWYISVTPCKKS